MYGFAIAWMSKSNILYLDSEIGRIVTFASHKKGAKIYQTTSDVCNHICTQFRENNTPIKSLPCEWRIKTLIMCKITLGWIIWRARRSAGISQRELSKELVDRGIEIDYYKLSKIENNHLDIRNRQHDQFIAAICQIFSLDASYVEEVRQQTEVEPPADLSQAVFPIYVKKLR